MKKAIVIIVVLFIAILAISTDKIRYSYIIKSENELGKIIDFECYRTVILSHEMLSFGKIYYNESIYKFTIANVNNYSDEKNNFTNSITLDTKEKEDSNYWYAPTMRLLDNYEVITLSLNMTDKHTGSSSSYTLEGNKQN